MKPGERIIWLRSSGRPFLDGWRLQRVPAEVVRICGRRIRIRVSLAGRQKLVNVDPDNVLHEKDQNATDPTDRNHGG
jgi:hypothetical protein